MRALRERHISGLCRPARFHLLTPNTNSTPSPNLHPILDFLSSLYPNPSQPELCSIVNSVLRDDIDSPILEAAVVFTVVLNKFTNAVRRCAACNGRAARTLERRVRASPLV